MLIYSADQFFGLNSPTMPVSNYQIIVVVIFFFYQEFSDSDSKPKGEWFLSFELSLAPSQTHFWSNNLSLLKAAYGSESLGNTY